jgi:uncharacterized membrane protein
MRQVGRLVSFSPLAYMRAVFNPWVALGISLLILWLFSHMTLLSWADLSYVLPVTSIGYVLSALAGKLFLHEEDLPLALGRHLVDRGRRGAGGAHRPAPRRRRVNESRSAIVKWLLVAVIAAATTISDVLQAAAMKRHGEIRDFRPGALGRLLAMLARNKLIVASVAAMTVSFFAFIALLSVADLSFAVPATAASYVLETVLAKYLLKEPVTLGRWAGASLVACGVALLSL